MTKQELIKSLLEHHKDTGDLEKMLHDSAAYGLGMMECKLENNEIVFRHIPRNRKRKWWQLWKLLPYSGSK